MLMLLLAVVPLLLNVNTVSAEKNERNIIATDAIGGPHGKGVSTDFLSRKIRTDTIQV